MCVHIKIHGKIADEREREKEGQTEKESVRLYNVLTAKDEEEE